MVSTDKEGVRKDWLKASIAVQGNDDPSKWTVRAKRSTDSGGGGGGGSGGGGGTKSGGGGGATTGTMHAFVRK